MWPSVYQQLLARPRASLPGAAPGPSDARLVALALLLPALRLVTVLTGEEDHHPLGVHL